MRKTGLWTMAISKGSGRLSTMIINNQAPAMTAMSWQKVYKTRYNISTKKYILLQRKNWGKCIGCKANGSGIDRDKKVNQPSN